MPDPSSLFQDYLRRMYGREARWTYWQQGNGPMFVYTTEPYNLRYGKDDVAQGKYESVVYMPYGPGSRSGKGRRWKAMPESRSYHALRRDAKARAWKLYQAWKTGDKTPWK